MLLIIQGLLQVLVQLEEYLYRQIRSVWTGIIFILILSAVIPLLLSSGSGEKTGTGDSGTSGRVASTTGSSGTDRGIGSL